MFCMNCGAKLPDGARFCCSCGASCSADASNGTAQSRKMMPGVGGTQLVAAKCTNCGAPLQVNPDMKSAECPFCHYTYMVDQAINNYNVSLNGSMHVENATINVEGVAIENYIKRADTFFKNGHMDQAVEYYEKALDIDPDNKELLWKVQEIKDHTFYVEDDILQALLKKSKLSLKLDRISFTISSLLGETATDYAVKDMELVKKGIFSQDEFWYQGRKISEWLTKDGSKWKILIENAKRGVYPTFTLNYNETADSENMGTDDSENMGTDDSIDRYIVNNFQGKKIAAIKYYREKKGCDLTAAKEHIDQLLG